MSALLALLPCAVVIVAVLGLHRSGLVAASAAFAVTAALWLSGVFAPVDAMALPHAVEDGLLLTSLVGSVIVAGLLYVEVCRRVGSLDAISRVIAALQLDPPKAAVVLVAGVGVMLESLTGFGVSLLVTVPLMLAMFERRQTIALGLIGMSLMPWGALAVSALLGAKLAGMPVPDLAGAFVWTSGPVAAVIPLVCLVFVSGVTPGSILFALAAGAALVGGIVLTNLAIGVEVAGVGGGLAVLALAVATAPDRQRALRAITAPPLALLGLLVAGVVAQKLLVPVLAQAGFAPVVGTSRVGYALMTSPGIALLLVAAFGALAWRRAVHRGSEPLASHVATRAWRSLLTIAVFLSMARLLVETGGIGALAGLLTQAGEYAAVAIVSGLAGVGAYVTGSAVPAAALFMPSAAATGQSFGHLNLFAALQHSAAGHTAMASLPIISILLAGLPNRTLADEREALRRGLLLAGLWMSLVVASGWVWLTFG